MDFVTVSRELGSGGADIAKQLANKLGYNFVDTQAIDDMAREMGILESVEKADEKAPSFFQRVLSHKPSIRTDHLHSVIFDLAKRGDSVFLGRGAQILLKSFDCALHVRVVASRPTRIRNLVARGYSEEAAARAIEKSDDERAAFIKFAFGVNWGDPRLFDLVINTDKLSVNAAVETILTLARSGDIKACSINAMESLGTMALKDRAEAAIIEAGLSWGQTYSVTVSVPEPGKVRLTGRVEEEKAKSRAEGVVKGVKGVESIENEIRISKSDRHA
jgi:cytidylate kinase